MYYIVSEDDGQVLEAQETMSNAEIQEAADYFGEAVYAIKGQHSGYSAECQTPPTTSPAPTPPEVVQARADIAGLHQGITSDEGQGRSYTEAEMRAALGAEKARVLSAVRGVVNEWFSATIVASMMSEISEALDKTPEVSNA